MTTTLKPHGPPLNVAVIADSADTLSDWRVCQSFFGQVIAAVINWRQATPSIPAVRRVSIRGRAFILRVREC